MAMSLGVFSRWIMGVNAVNDTATGNSNVTSCCDYLQHRFASMVSYPGSSTYEREQIGKPNSGYWTQQEESLTPACRFTPNTADQVAMAVSYLADQNCLFAVRGGGHTSWAGAANIDSCGLTIDLSNMTNLQLSKDEKAVHVGGGARWSDVYSYLGKQNLAISGGRVFDVGVGGLTLGGGKSFFASTRGFTCDNVVNYELISGRGKILNVNQTSYPDLFKALKGGTNNFGIVTRFDFATFKQGNLWGGQIVYDASTIVQQYQALYDFTLYTSTVPYPLPAAAEIIMAYIRMPNNSFAFNYLTYTDPVENPPVFDNFTRIPSLVSTTRLAPLLDLTIELGAGTPNGYRQLLTTFTFTSNLEFFNALRDIATKAYDPLFTAKTPDLQTSFVLQPISPASLIPGCGHNSLGLCPSNSSLVILDLTVQWGRASDDDAVEGAARSVIEQGSALAKKMGIFNKYVYLNYALPFQKPFEGYGNASYAELKRVSAKYDPQQVFQRLVPGGFKLNEQ